MGKATIEISDREIDVQFEGLWTKQMVEAAHWAMLKGLRAHIVKGHSEKSETQIRKGMKK